MTDDAARIAQLEAENRALRAENTSLRAENGDLRGDLSEALEQQTATSEILKVISRSATDLETIFDAIIRSGTRLCDGAIGVVYRFDGEQISIAAHDRLSADGLALLVQRYPRPIGGGQPVDRAILDGIVIHVRDRQTAQEYAPVATATVVGWHTYLAVPMLRDGTPIGALGIARREVRPFSERQIALLESFADQAVIAIENAQLFEDLQRRNSELQESNRQVTDALEQQTATAEILRVIASSPADLQQVLSEVAQSAMRHSHSTESVLCLLADVTTGGDAPDSDEVEARYREALAQSEELGMRPLQAHCHLGLGKLYLRVKRLEEARAELATAVAMLREMGMAFWLPEAEHDNMRAALQVFAEQDEVELGLRLSGALSHFWNACGYHAEGRAHLGEALRPDRAQAYPAARAKVLCELGFLTSDKGDDVAARALIEESLAIMRACGDRYGVSRALIGLGWVGIGQHDHAGARRLVAESLAIAHGPGYPRVVIDGLETFAYLAASINRMARTARLHGAAEALRETLGVPITTLERALYDPAAVRAAPELATAWAEGRAMTLEQAFAYALDEQPPP